MKLAYNSYNVKKYSRTADNCRLAVDMAIRQKNSAQAAEAYRLWIASLFEQNKYGEVKRICCDARSKFGSSLDLVYFEFKASYLAGDTEKALRLAAEFKEVGKSVDAQNPTAFETTSDKIGEVQSILENINSGTNNEAKQAEHRDEEQQKEFKEIS